MSEQDTVVNAPAGEANVTSREGEAKVKQADASLDILNLAKEVTNRDFRSLDEVKNWMKTANSSIGKVSQLEAALAQKEQVVDLDIDNLPDLVQNELKQLKDKLSKTEFNFQKSELLRTYPEAKDDLEDVAAIANRRGISLLEAVESSRHKNFYDTERARSQKEKEEKSRILETSPRRGISGDRLQELSKQYDQAKKTGRGGDELATELVREYFGQ